jgi:hypothetical protein
LDTGDLLLRADSGNMAGAYAPAVIGNHGSVVAPPYHLGDGFRAAQLSTDTVTSLRRCLEDGRFQTSPSYVSEEGTSTTAASARSPTSR